jgi:archaellum component FlaC
MGYVNQLENNNKELMNIVEEFNKKYNILMKKEELAKANLIDSQMKWSQFSRDVVGLAKVV